MKILDIYVIDGYRIIEYVTYYGVQRFDIQPWKGEKEVKLPMEISDSNWEVRIFSIPIFARFSARTF